MINYTERLTLLMQDIVRRVPTLSFIDIARRARVRARRPIERRGRVRDLPLPHACRRASRATTSGAIARRGTHHAPLGVVRHQVAGRHRSARAPIKYMISFALPRFCDQSLDRSRKERFYPGAEPWIAKLDTVDPRAVSHRSRARTASAASSAATAPTRPTATASASSSRSPRWCTTYLDDAGPIRPSTISCGTTSTRSNARYGGVVGTSFRTFPSFPQRYIERLPMQPPCEADGDGVDVEPLRVAAAAARATREDDLHIRQFMPRDVAQRLVREGPVQRGVRAFVDSAFSY